MYIEAPLEVFFLRIVAVCLFLETCPIPVCCFRKSAKLLSEQIRGIVYYHAISVNLICEEI
jgi:hypothetical protein